MEQRIHSIDFLRGITVIFMIQVHIYYHWIYSKIEYGIFNTIIFFFGSYAAPFFLLVSGMSFYIFISQKKSKELRKSKIFIDVFKRALFIFVITTFFQLIFGLFFNMHFHSIIYWSVFQVISFSMVIFFILPFLKKKIKLLLYFILIPFIIFLFFIIIFFKIEFLYFLTGGTFGFLPWAIFYLIGLELSDLLVVSQQGRINITFYMILLIGIILSILGFYNILILNVIGNNTAIYYMECLGSFIILFLISYFILDIKKKNSVFTNIMIRWGKLAFSIYYIQYVIIGLGIIIFPLLINELYASGFLIYQYFILLFGVFIVIELFLRLWQKFNYKFGLEWFMNKISHRSYFFNKDLKKEEDTSNNS